MPDVKHFDPEQTLAVVERLFWRQGVAATGVQDLVSATGLSRSSLYATFGGKEDLYVAALRRYVEDRSLPMFDRLAGDDRGLAAVAGFFDRLIRLRCTGEHAGWGCLVSDAHTAAKVGRPVRELLDRHHDRLRTALRTALTQADRLDQLRPGTEMEGTAELLTLLAYGVNLRSRAGKPRAELQAGVDATLAALAKDASGLR